MAHKNDVQDDITVGNDALEERGANLRDYQCTESVRNATSLSTEENLK
jgi:hypothetical protein